MKIKTYIFSVLTFLLMVENAYADPIININTTYYDISGRTSRDLRREMAEKGPFLDNPKHRYWAITRWRVSWTPDYGPLHVDRELSRKLYSSAPNLRTGSGCKVNSVRTTVSIDYTYPRWTNRANPYSDMGRKWDRMYQALVAHEETHARHGISAAKQIESELLKLSGNSHCSGNSNFIREVNNRAQQIIQHYSNADIQFDQRTDHGVNEGVKLP